MSGGLFFSSSLSSFRPEVALVLVLVLLFREFRAEEEEWTGQTESESGGRREEEGWEIMAVALKS